MNRIDKILGFPVTVVNEATGDRQTVMVPMSGADFEHQLWEEVWDYDAEAEGDIEPAEVEVVAQVYEDRATIRFWSPLDGDEGRQVIAAMVATWKEGNRV